MRVVSKIDEQGFFVEDVLLADNAALPSSEYVESRPPQGFHKPKWDGTREPAAWVEGKAAAEIFLEAKASKEAELRDAADSWYRMNVRAFEGAVVAAKWAKGQALLAEEQVVFNDMNASYTRLKSLISQVRAATTVAEVEAISWTP
jgi:hypothetical protein